MSMTHLQINNHIKTMKLQLYKPQLMSDIGSHLPPHPQKKDLM